MLEQKLSDKEQIKEAISAVNELQDHRQWERLEAYFAENLYVDQQSINGEPAAIIPRRRLISDWRRELSAYFYATKHLIQQLAIKVSGNRAKATSQVSNTHYVTDRGDRYAWTVKGTWNYELVKKAGRWQIARMIFQIKDQAVRPIGG